MIKKPFLSSIIIYFFFIISSFPAQSSDPKSNPKLAVWEIRGGSVSGSGFFIDKKHFVTAFHVVESIFNSRYRSDKIFSKLFRKDLTFPNISLSQDNNPNILKIKGVVALSYIFDLAVLEIDGETSHYLSLANDPMKTNSLTLLGYRDGFKEIKASGEVMDKSIFYNLKTAPFLIHGMSGGPIINNKAEVEAVLSSSSNPRLIELLTEPYYVEDMIVVAVKAHYIKEIMKFQKRSETLSEFLKVVDSSLLKQKRDLYNLALEGRALEQYILSYKLRISKEQDFFFKLMRADKVIASNNEDISIYWLKKAASNDLAPALYELSMYLFGRGSRLYFQSSLNDKESKEDLIQSGYYMEEAAKLDYAPAQFMTAVFYHKGLNKNLEKAFYWMKKSAEQDYVLAQYSLALMYKEAEGVEQDLKQSFYWMKKSAELGNARAPYDLALMYKEAEGVEQDLKQSFYWMKKSAELGDERAPYELALMYKRAEGVKQDFKQAIHWLEKVNKTESYLHLYELASLYGLEKNFELAGQFFIQAEEQKKASPVEIVKLLELQNNKESKTKIFETVKELAKGSSYAVSQYKLAQIYAKGEGTKPEAQLAFKWMKKSAEQGYTPAQYELSQMYAKGMGTKPHSLQASYWLAEAALGNHPLALKERTDCHNVFLFPQSL